MCHDILGLPIYSRVNRTGWMNHAGIKSDNHNLSDENNKQTMIYRSILNCSTPVHKHSARIEKDTTPSLERRY